MVNYDPENDKILDLEKEEWEQIYEKLFGGFEDLKETEDADNHEIDELELISPDKKTKSGYLKDDFVVDDSDSLSEQDSEEYDNDDGNDLTNDAEEENFDGPDEPEEEEPAIEGDAYNIGLSIEVDENGYAKVNQSQVQLKEEVGDLYDPSEVTIGVNRKLKFDL